MLLIDQNISYPTIESVDPKSEHFIVDKLTSYPYPPPEAEDIRENDTLSDLALFISGPYMDVNIQSSVDSMDSDDEDSYGPEISSVTNENDSQSTFAKWEFDAQDSFAYENGMTSQNFAPVKKSFRIQFITDPNSKDEVFCQKYENAIILNSKECSRRWYRSSDIKKFRRMAHTEALCARASSSYVEQFRFLYASCDDSTSLQSLSHMLASNLASSQYRGFESIVFSDLYRIARKSILQEVLKVQSDYRFTHRCSSEILEALLASRSKQLSKQSRRVAYVIGEGDADVARSLFTSKELEFSMTSTRKYQREPTTLEI
jgi:hypothetical protein